MINVQKCLKFIALQNSINKDIDTVGQTTVEKADKLDRLGDKLNEQEIDWIYEMSIDDEYYD